MTLGEKIYKLRTERNLSQGELSEMLEVSRQSISKWENGAATPDLDKIIKLSGIFKITIDELVKNEEISVFASEEAKKDVIVIKKESNFPPRKIIGTVLLSLSLIVTVVLLAAGGGIVGLVLSLPLILCGIICFVFKKNIGLWCFWAVFFCIDMYLRLATGINSSAILNFRALLFMIRGGDFLRLLLFFLQLLAILSLIPLISTNRSGSSSIIRNVSSLNFRTILPANETPTPLIAPDARYRSTATASSGGTTT